jgi:hypothetical protein
MFSEVQQMAIIDERDSERFRVSSAPSTDQTAKQPLSGRAGLKRGASMATPSGVSRSTDGPKFAEIKHKMEVADAVMKKLHKKNQQLVQEVAQLKESQGGGVSSSGGHVAPTDEVTALKRELARKDADVQRLKQLVTTAGAHHAAPPSAIPGASASPAPLPTNALQRQLADLQQRYSELLEAKIECVHMGESTGRVNKEVKAFFTTLRKRLQDEVKEREVERQLLNEQLLAQERRLCEHETRSPASHAH